MISSTAQSVSSAASAASKEQRWKRIIEKYDHQGRVLLTQNGFDPDDVHKVNRHDRTPMLYFSALGHFNMVEYLIARGADCRKVDSNGWFPLLRAVRNGNLEILKLLSQDGGAHADIRRVTRMGISPLRMALIRGQFDVAQYLILKEVLSPRDDVAGGGIDDATMRRDFDPSDWDNDKRRVLRAWAQDVVTTHDNIVKALLAGTMVYRHPKNNYATRSKKRRKLSSSSPLVVFQGTLGVLKVVAEYAIDHTPQELRILRQLSSRLSTFLDDVPFVPQGRRSG